MKHDVNTHISKLSNDSNEVKLVESKQEDQLIFTLSII